MLNGVIPIYKPKGIPSTQITRSLRAMLRQPNIGHVGTLDPAAQGLMLILVGKATRLEQLLHLYPKTYLVAAEFGYETDTLDLEGTVVADTKRIDFSRSEIFSACQLQIGKITQTPPLFAAVKYRGQPLHYYARRNLPVPLMQLQRQVYIASLRIISWHKSRLELCVTCAKGVYIRSLVRDIAHSLNSYATVLDITRTEAYGLDSRAAWQFTEINATDVHERLLPITSLPLPRMQISDAAQLHRLRNGNKLMYDKVRYRLSSDDASYGAACRDQFLLTDAVGGAFGIGVFGDNGRSLHMQKSLHTVY